MPPTVERDPRVVAMIQARMNSSRFPGKVLAPIDGLPMLLRCYQRVDQTNLTNGIVVVTSDSAADSPIRAHCCLNGITVFAGSEQNVLERFVHAAQAYDADVVVRITADCPLVCPDVIDTVIERFFAGEVDYCANVLEPGYPDGLDVEVVTREALEVALWVTSAPADQEHVTRHIRQHPERFRLRSVPHTPDLSGLKLSVDTIEDLALVRDIYRVIGRETFGLDDILAALQQLGHLRKEGTLWRIAYSKSTGVPKRRHMSRKRS